MHTTAASTSSFRRALAWRRDGEVFHLDVEDSWAQGRAAYGGLMAAAALGALQSQVEAPRSVRSLQINYVGPVAPGPVQCRVERLRAGSSATQVLARVEQAGQVRLLATGVFGEARASRALVAPAAPPAMPPVDTLDELPYIEGLTPAFTRHFRFRWGRGSLPFSGGPTADMGGYLRFAEDVGPVDAQVVVGLFDAWPAPVMSMMQQLARGSTMSWSVDVLQPLPDHGADGWWRYAADTLVARDGYAAHQEWLWTPEGVPVARANQLVAVFG